MHLDLIKIKPHKPSSDESLSEEAYLSFVEDLLRQMIPEEILIGSTDPGSTPKDSFIIPLEQQLPLLSFQFLSYRDKTLRASVLCPADFTQGLGRFFTDILAKSLLPGKLFSFFASKALNFKFLVYPHRSFYLCENCIDLETNENMEAVKKRLDLIEKHMRLTILAVMHARKLVNSKRLSNQEKHMLLMENLMGLKEKGSALDVDNLFNQSYKLLSTAYSEKMEHSFAPKSVQPPQTSTTVFDHNIFRTMYKEVSFIFEKSTIAHYPIDYLNKLVSYCYLFQKRLKHAILNKQSLEDSIKITHLVKKEGLRSTFQLGILVALVLETNEPEVQEKQLMQILYRFNTSLCFGKTHIFTSRFLDKKIASLYFEASKPENEPFTPTEISYWKTHLLHHLKEEIKGRIVSPRQTSLFFEEQGLFLQLRDAYYKLGVKSLVHSCLSPSDEKPGLASFFILEAGNIDALYLENSKLSPYEIGAHQKKAIGTNAQGHVVYYHSFKMFASQPDTVPKEPSENLEQMIAQLETIFGPLYRFSSYFLKKCPPKLIELKEALHSLSDTKLIEHIYFSLTPKAHRLSLEVDLLKRFILFCHQQLPSVGKTHTLTEVGGTTLFVLTDGANMKKVRSSLRLSPSLSITEFYTRIKNKQIFGACILSSTEELSKEHARNIVDSSVQFELSARLRRKKRNTSSLV